MHVTDRIQMDQRGYTSDEQDHRDHGEHDDPGPDLHGGHHDPGDQD